MKPPQPLTVAALYLAAWAVALAIVLLAFGCRIIVLTH